MTIIERLQQYKELEPHKIALIVDDIQYTYGELYDAILSVNINNTSHIVNFTQSKETLKTKVLLIKELSFVEQLTQWLGAIYKDNIPMVCHNEMDKAYVDELARIIAYEGVPPLADFGVLTSGTTGRPKPLLKSFYKGVLVSQVLAIWLLPLYGLEGPLLLRVHCVLVDGYSS